MTAFLQRHPWLVPIVTLTNIVLGILDNLDRLDFILDPPQWLGPSAEVAWTYGREWGPWILAIIGLFFWAIQLRQGRGSRKYGAGSRGPEARLLERNWSKLSFQVRDLLSELHSAGGTASLTWYHPGLKESLRLGFVELQEFGDGVRSIYRIHPDVAPVVKRKFRRRLRWKQRK